MQQEYLKVLSLKESVLSADERYLLLRVAAVFGERLVAEGVRELEQGLGMSARNFRETRDSLLAKGFLVQPPREESAATRGSQAGRPRACFRVHAGPLPGVAEAMRLKPPHGVGELIQRMAVSRFQPLIRELVFWQLPEEGEARSGLDKLRPATRLLLAVLLGLADQGGVVREVGLGRLAHLVGMKRDRLEYHLETLAALGFIRVRIKGLTGKFLFGQVAGAMVLNVAHEAFLSRLPQVLICIEDEERVLHREEDGLDVLQLYTLLRTRGGRRAIKGQYAGSLIPFQGVGAEPYGDGCLRDQSLREVVSLINSEPPPGADEHALGVMHVRTGFDPQEGLLGGQVPWFAHRLRQHFELERMFAGSPAQAFGRYLQYKIDQYVCLLLSDHWSSIRTWPKGVESTVWERICPEIITPANLAELREWEMPEEFQEAFQLYIYLLVLRRAYWVKSMLVFDVPASALGGKPEACDYVLLPSAPYQSRERLAILAIPRGPVPAMPPPPVTAVRRRAAPLDQPVWKLGDAELIGTPKVEDYRLFWQQPFVRPQVLRGIAGGRSPTGGVPGRPRQ